ncbi:MAG: hypothetical protein ACOX0C_00275 [Patescibacteria group bacterium]|jgi:hypothetical protein
MNKQLKSVLSLVLMSLTLISPYFIFTKPSLAQTGALERLNQVASDSYGSGTDLPTLIGIIINSILSLLGTIFIILMVYAGFRWMTASGNEKEVGKAQDMVKTAIIGLVITLSSWAIWQFLLSKFIMRIIG